jgi:protein-tyrosine phosphatase
MDAYWIPSSTGRLAIVRRPRGGDWLADDIGELSRAKVDLAISALTDSENEELSLREEGSLCAAADIEFLSIPIEDRSIPPSARNFRRRLELADKYLAEGKTVTVHCRMGIGRSSIIAAALLIHQGIAPSEAFEAIEKARGWPVPDTPEQRAWIEHEFVAEALRGSVGDDETGVE